MKFTKPFLFFAALMLGISFSACNEDDIDTSGEEELITTLTYTLTPDGGGDTVVFKFADLDGDGGDNPTYENGTLAANTTYTGSLEFLNESESPAEDITEEILEEALEHQVFFNLQGVGGTIAYTDKDSNDQPLGLETTFTTAEAGNGALTIVLRHEPNKDGEGVAGGDITNAGGETDIEVTFQVAVQ